MNKILSLLITSIITLTFSPNSLSASNQNSFRKLEKEANLYIGYKACANTLNKGVTYEFQEI